MNSHLAPKIPGFCVACMDAGGGCERGCGSSGNLRDSLLLRVIWRLEKFARSKFSRNPRRGEEQEAPNNHGNFECDLIRSELIGNSLINIFFTIILFSLLTTSVLAHKPSDSYLFLQENNNDLTLRWDIALRDMEEVVGLDGNRDQEISWVELKEKRKDIVAYALSRLQIEKGGKTCLFIPYDFQVTRHSDGGYAVLWNKLVCGDNSSELFFNYSLLFEIDPTHRGILLDQRNGDNRSPYILSPGKNSLELSDRGNSLPHTLYDYVREGVLHIWVGYDHILFIEGVQITV